MKVELRKYQSDSVDKIRLAFMANYKKVLLVLPTGAGKTVAFCDIGEKAESKGNRVMVLVHRQELLRQTSDHLQFLGVDHGLIAPGHTMTGHKFQIASVQTLVRRLNQVQQPNLLIVDEAHHVVAGSWRKIVDAWKTSYILGVTATPMRLDGKGLGNFAGGYFDSLIEGPNIQDLIRDGYLAQPVVYRPPTNIDLSGLHMRGKDYDSKELEIRTNRATITGCVISHYKRICPGVPAIAFCATVKHAADVAEMFNAAGIAAASLDGSMSSGMRKHRIQSLANGSLKVLTSCDIVSEGTDIPVVTAAILLRATHSTGLYLQQVGRCLRPVFDKSVRREDLQTAEQRLSAMASGPKPRAIILDHVGNCLKHGLPDDTREWTLNGYVKPKKNSDKTPSVRTCKKCYAVFSMGRLTCPQCGFSVTVKEKKISQVDGELVLARPEDVEAERVRVAARQRVGMAKSLEDLFRIADQRGYKRDWAYHIWNARQAKKQREFAGAF